MGFHKSNPSGLTVKEVAELAQQGKLSSYKAEENYLKSAPHPHPAPYDTEKINELIALGNSAWKPENRKYFGKLHDEAVTEINCAATFGQVSHPHTHRLMLCRLSRGWFEKEEDREKVRKRRFHENKLLQEANRNKLLDPSTDLGKLSLSVTLLSHKLREEPGKVYDEDFRKQVKDMISLRRKLMDDFSLNQRNGGLIILESLVEMLNKINKLHPSNDETTSTADSSDHNYFEKQEEILTAELTQMKKQYSRSALRK